MDAAIAAAIAAAASQAPMPKALEVPAMVPGRFLLVDGDYVAYYCGGSEDKETSPGESRQMARERIQRMQTLSGAEHVVVHLTDNASTKGDRFIAATVKPYQGNRAGVSRKPKNWAFLRDWMERGGDGLFRVKSWMDREADDGATYHALVLGPERAVLSVADKDWRMSPGWHMDWKSWLLTYCPPGTFFLDGIDGHWHGEKFFWYQLLAGDTADNIPGLPKYMDNGKAKPIGEVTAKQFLSGCDDNVSAFRVVAQLYRGYYAEAWQDRLAEQMSLLWMRRGKEAAVDDCLDHLGPAIEKVMRPAFDTLARRILLAKDALKEIECKS